MPLVNNLLSHPEERFDRYPLKVVRCTNCTLAQLTAAPPPPKLFDEYLYFSSQSQTMVEHAGRLVKRFVTPGQRVVEIASNDGYLLKQAKHAGAMVLGVDPARNIAEYANSHGVFTKCDYFTPAVAHSIANEWGKADVVFANNVLAHVPDPNQIIEGIRILLAERGRAHVEVPSLMWMIHACAFDTIYHEHQCYFSLTALRQLCDRNGLTIVGAETAAIHGESYHIQLAHRGDHTQADELIAREMRAGIHDESIYQEFRSRIAQLRDDLNSVLSEFDSIAAYGAAAKGIVLLNALELGPSVIPWVADVSPYKQGKYIPGTLQPVVSPAELQRAAPEATLLLPWNIADEIIRRNHEYLNQGGRFIVPIPEMRIFTAQPTGAAAQR